MYIVIKLICSLGQAATTSGTVNVQLQNEKNANSTVVCTPVVQISKSALDKI